MDDISAAIRSVLNDPQSMAQLLARLGTEVTETSASSQLQSRVFYYSHSTRDRRFESLFEGAKLTDEERNVLKAMAHTYLQADAPLPNASTRKP